LSVHGLLGRQQAQERSETRALRLPGVNYFA